MRATLVVGATSTLGARICQRAAQAGRRLVLLDTDEGELAELDYRLAQSELHRFAALNSITAPPRDLGRVLADADAPGTVSKLDNVVLVPSAATAADAWLEATLELPGPAPQRALLVSAEPLEQLRLRIELLDNQWRPSGLCVLGIAVPTRTIATALDDFDVAETTAATVLALLEPWSLASPGLIVPILDVSSTPTPT